MSSIFTKAERLQHNGLSVIVQLSEQAQAMKEQGQRIINLCVGEPDFDTPEHVKAAAQQAMVLQQTKYTATAGTTALKTAISHKFSKQYASEISAQEVMVSNGAKQVLFNALFASLNPGDQVIVPAPYWTSYPDMISVCGGISKVVQCDPAKGFKITADALEASIGPDTRWLLLNSPCNPTGSVYSQKELRAIADVLLKYPHVWIMADEIYEHLLYDDQNFASFRKVAPELADRTLIVNGVSKAYAMTGWRVGYGLGPKGLIAAMTAVQNQSTSGVCSIAQAAATAALTGPQGILHQRCESFRQRRDSVVKSINAIAGLQCNTPDGAFYVFVDCAAFVGSLKPDNTDIKTSFDFCQYLLQAAGIAVVPGSAFGLENFFRLSYAASMAELQQACLSIKQACDALTPAAVAA